MPKERERWRSKSDAVFRIAKTAGTGIYKRLKAFNDVFSKKSNQFKYYDYCYHLDEWSAEKEKEDWEGYNIASLKHATLRWLVKSLTVITDWQEKDLGSLYLEITRASSLQGDDWALALTMEAIELGMKEEEYELVLKILRHQRLLIDRYMTPESRGEALEESFQWHDVAWGRMAEIAQWERWHFQYFHGLSIQNEQKGRVSSEELSKLDEFLQIHPMAGIETVTAKRIFLTMSMGRFALMKNPKAAFEAGKAMIDLYDSNPWIKDRFLQQYISHLKYVSSIAEFEGDSKYATDVLDRMSELGEGVESVRKVAIPNLIQARIRISDLRQDKIMGRDALKMLLENWNSVEEVLKPETFAWLLFRCSKAAILDHDFATAAKLLDELIPKASRCNADLRIHARLMNLLVRVAKGVDRDWLEHYCHSTSIFLSRNPNSNPTQTMIVNAIRHALRGTQMALITNVFDPIVVLIESDAEHKKAASGNGYFDYLAWFKQFSQVVHNLNKD